MDKLLADQEKLKKQAKAKQDAVDNALSKKIKAEQDLKAALSQKQEMSTKYDESINELTKTGEKWAKVEAEIAAKPIEEVQAEYDAEKEKVLAQLKKKEDEKKT